MTRSTLSCSSCGLQASENQPGQLRLASIRQRPPTGSYPPLATRVYGALRTPQVDVNVITTFGVLLAVYKHPRNQPAQCGLGTDIRQRAPIDRIRQQWHRQVYTASGCRYYRFLMSAVLSPGSNCCISSFEPSSLNRRTSQRPRIAYAG